MRPETAEAMRLSFRWREEKEARAKGRAETHTLRNGKQVLAVVRKHRGGGWFWYTAPGITPERNTAQQPVAMIDDAMLAARDHCRAALIATPDRETLDAGR